MAKAKTTKANQTFAGKALLTGAEMAVGLVTSAISGIAAVARERKSQWRKAAGSGSSKKAGKTSGKTASKTARSGAARSRASSQSKRAKSGSSAKSSSGGAKKGSGSGKSR